MAWAAITVFVWVSETKVIISERSIPKAKVNQYNIIKYDII